MLILAKKFSNEENKMKKMEQAGSLMTANQDENTCKKVLYRETDKISRPIIDAENCFKKRIIRGFGGVFVDCDTLQAAREEQMRYARTCTAGQKYIEVA